MTTTVHFKNLEFHFSDDDIVNPDDFEPAGSRWSKPLWILHDHGFTICAVFADDLQDALDEAVDAGKLNSFLIPTPGSADSDREETSLELRDYVTSDPDEMAAGSDRECPEFEIDGVPHWWATAPAFLGNAGEPFDIETLGYVKIDAPEMSICRLYGESVQASEMHLV